MIGPCRSCGRRLPQLLVNLFSHAMRVHIYINSHIHVHVHLSTVHHLIYQCYNLKLVSVYESPSMIYMITEYCEGGEMIPYVSKAFKDAGGLRTEDVSRISYQLWSAVNHCVKHNVIHRDIKPENVMFTTSKKDSDLRLIDFGSGTCDGISVQQGDDEDLSRHHTFAGSAFYISPEMFQRNYTPKTDVWSAGATLYVLVAGYPAERLQETFNVLQSSKAHRLRQLPNMPNNMPDSFYDMLEGALAYKHKVRSTAGQLMNGEFAQFHIQHDPQDNATEAVQEAPASPARTKSVLLEGSVSRHSVYLGYQKFERSVTTILATMLSKENARRLLALLDEESKKESTKNGNAFGDEAIEEPLTDLKTNKEKLQVVTIANLLDVLGLMKDGTLLSEDIVDVLRMIRSLKDFIWYETFAYHISNLRQFVSIQMMAPTRQSKVGTKWNLNTSHHGFSSMRKLLGDDTDRTESLNMSMR